MPRKKNLDPSTVFTPQNFRRPLHEVAKELGVCPSVLKIFSRSHGLPRWPYRRLRALDHALEARSGVHGHTEMIEERARLLGWRPDPKARSERAESSGAISPPPRTKGLQRRWSGPIDEGGPSGSSRTAFSIPPPSYSLASLPPVLHSPVASRGRPQLWMSRTPPPPTVHHSLTRMGHSRAHSLPSIESDLSSDTRVSHRLWPYPPHTGTSNTLPPLRGIDCVPERAASASAIVLPPLPSRVDSPCLPSSSSLSPALISGGDDVYPLLPSISQLLLTEDDPDDFQGGVYSHVSQPINPSQPQPSTTNQSTHNQSTHNQSTHNQSTHNQSYHPYHPSTTNQPIIPNTQ
eukprot:TRINITY_DN551_c0_g1_i1.p1 TRINITY_DN551_c0_g1~~TRINITY_DN551_c0_g1_i1.p1  ORF type:complete len:347 (+),score=26.20 TRINITY_DN551_c0_g1_i1:87-1127(+)